MLRTVKGADCKSAGICRWGFDSLSAQEIIIKLLQQEIDLRINGRVVECALLEIKFLLAVKQRFESSLIRIYTIWYV